MTVLTIKSNRTTTSVTGASGQFIAVFYGKKRDRDAHAKLFVDSISKPGLQRIRVLREPSR